MEDIKDLYKKKGNRSINRLRNQGKENKDRHANCHRYDIESTFTGFYHH